jgi:hypothetical protein
MANPTMGWLVLRRAPGKRPLQQSDRRKWVRFGVHRQAFSSESQFGFEISQRVSTMAASEAANGKFRSIAIELGPSCRQDAIAPTPRDGMRDGLG